MKILQYLTGAINEVLAHCQGRNYDKLQVYRDSNWKERRRSILGGIVMPEEAAMSCFSQMQQVVANFKTEAGLMVMSEAQKDVLFLCQVQLFMTPG